MTLATNAAFARLVLELCSYGQILDTHLSQLQCWDTICCMLPLETAVRKAKWYPVARGKEHDCCAVGLVGVSLLSKLVGKGWEQQPAPGQGTSVGNWLFCRNFSSFQAGACHGRKCEVVRAWLTCFCLFRFVLLCFMLDV